ncbi:MAG TPA: hypothetical protein VK484_13680 [Ferruginibacter sp.]|nr:hypothetical protein [Ferruginibacter sp.]
MQNKAVQAILLFVLAGSVFSCSPKIISTNYYYENEKILDSIEEKFKKLSQQKPFTIGFTAKDFSTVSIEIITDTLTYVYEFRIGERRLYDTLVRFRLDAPQITRLITQMQGIRCTWIKNQDYYVDEKKNSLVFMSIRAVALKRPFSYQKYYVLAYFNQPQHFDSEGRLLDKRRLRRLRKINGEIFHRINDKVCYTISGKFR